MATLTIPWNDGNGNIILTYTGQGDGTITVRSDTDNDGAERSQAFTIKTSDGSVRKTITIRQASGMMYLTAQTVQLVSSDGLLLRVKPPRMQNLLANGEALVTSDGRTLRVNEL